MSGPIANVALLKPEIRLAQAVSQFEADLSIEQKNALRKQKSQPPDHRDVMRLTTEIDRTSGIVAGGRCFGPRLTSFLGAVQKFAALGDVVVGGSQNVIACSVWAVVRMSLLSIATYSSYLDKLSSLFMSVGRSAPGYQTLAMLYPQSKRLQADLAEYFVVVVGFCHQIWKFAQKSAINKFVSALSDSDLRKYQSSLENRANAIKEEVNLLMAKEVHKDGREIARIRTLVTQGASFASHQRNLMTKLRVLDLCSTYDFLTAWKQTRKIGHCSLVSQNPDYQCWRSQESSSTLICTGKLGSGKSVLLANIVDDLNTWVQQKTTPVVYFFCRHDISESLTTRTIFGSLARQLLLSIPDLALSKGLPNETTLYLDIEDICSLIQRIFPRNNPAYIVLDGLDECEPMTRDLLVQQLRELQKTITLHLCISFRLDPVTNKILNLNGLPVTRTISMPDDNPDIKAYIYSESDNLIASGKLKMGNPAIIQEIRQKLAEGSHGMFLWAALQLQSLCTGRTDDEIRRALDNLPKDLPETFMRILERSREQGEVYQSRILELVAAAFQPLTTEELREALSVTPGDTVWRPSGLINDIISTLGCCGGLVIVDEEEKTVRLVHHSFKRFLLTRFKDPSQEKFTMDLAHKNVADTIVTYLNYGVFGTDLSTTVIPRMEMGSAPSKIVRETIGSITGRSIALKWPKSRKMPNFDISKTIMDTGSGYNTCSLNSFYFHDYAKSFCMQHTLCAFPKEPGFPKLLAKLCNKDVISADAPIQGNVNILLEWATQNGHEAIVKLLLETGKVENDMKGSFGQRMLLLAAQNGHEAVVKLLLETGKVENDMKGSFGQRMLLLAAQNGHEAVVKLLLETGKVKNGMKGSFGQRMLLLAAQNGHETVVKLLLETGQLNIDLVDLKGQTPLSWAVKNGHEAVIKLLLETGKVNINMTDFDGDSPLLLAMQNGHEAVVKLLLETGQIYITGKDPSAQTLLSWAIQGGYEAVVRLLLRSGKVHIDLEDSNGKTPLSWAAENGHEALVKLLLETGQVNINTRDSYGQTPLSKAAENGHEAVVKLLLETGQVNINTRDGYGQTSLLKAAGNGHEAVVKLLLEMSKDDIHTRDSYGQTPFSRAFENGHEAVLKLLKSASAS